MLRQPARSQSQIEERDEVERVVMEHGVHVALEAGADVVGVHARDAVARDVVGAMAAADVLLERLQPAVGQLLSPAAAGVVEDVDVEEVVRRRDGLQAMPNAALDDHRPVECLAVEREQHLMVGDRLPERGEDGGFFGVIAGEQQLDRRLAFDLAEKADEEQGRAGQAAGFEVQADGAIGKCTDEGGELGGQHERWFDRLLGGGQLRLQKFLAGGD